MIKQDWLMRQIEMTVQMIARLIFHKDAVEYEQEGENVLTEADQRYISLMALMDEGRICEAEDYLFDTFSLEDPHQLMAAIEFYQKLNEKSDDVLEQANFSREEIQEGLEELMARAGIVMP